MHPWRFHVYPRVKNKRTKIPTKDVMFSTKALLFPIYQCETSTSYLLKFYTTQSIANISLTYNTKKVMNNFYICKLNMSLSNKQPKLNFLNGLHHRIASLCSLLTQAAFWRPNHTILTKSVNAILKAVTTMFIGDQICGWSEFFIYVSRFLQRERVL